MNKRDTIISIVAVLVILFLIFVFYSKSQWYFIDSDAISKAEAEKAAKEPAGQKGHVSFTIFSKNETNRCNNSFDDDNDTFTDCEDSDCFEDIWCQDGEI